MIVDDTVSFYPAVAMLWKRLQDFQRLRHVYKSLVVIEHLLRHASERFVQYARASTDLFRRLTRYKYIKRGNEVGGHVRSKACAIHDLLSDQEVLEEARKVARRLEGKIFGLSHEFDYQSLKQDESRAALVQDEDQKQNQWNQSDVGRYDPVYPANHVSCNESGAKSDKKLKPQAPGDRHESMSSTLNRGGDAWEDFDNAPEFLESLDFGQESNNPESGFFLFDDFSLDSQSTENAHINNPFVHDQDSEGMFERYFQNQPEPRSVVQHENVAQEVEESLDPWELTANALVNINDLTESHQDASVRKRFYQVERQASVPTLKDMKSRLDRSNTFTLCKFDIETDLICSRTQRK
jgi:hypothetical protein